jgi:hypothetical protein
MNEWVGLGTLIFGTATTIATVVRLWITGNRSDLAKSNRKLRAENHELKESRQACSDALQQARMELLIWKEKRP